MFTWRHRRTVAAMAVASCMATIAIALTLALTTSFTGVSPTLRGEFREATGYNYECVWSYRVLNRFGATRVQVRGTALCGPLNAERPRTADEIPSWCDARQWIQDMDVGGIDVIRDDAFGLPFRCLSYRWDHSVDASRSIMPRGLNLSAVLEEVGNPVTLAQRTETAVALPTFVLWPGFLANWGLTFIVMAALALCIFGRAGRQAGRRRCPKCRYIVVGEVCSECGQSLGAIGRWGG